MARLKAASGASEQTVTYATRFRMTARIITRSAFLAVAVVAVVVPAPGNARQDTKTAQQVPAPAARVLIPDYHSLRGWVTARDATSIAIKGFTVGVNGGEGLSDEERRLDFANRRSTTRGERMTVFVVPGRVEICQEVVYRVDSVTLTRFDGSIATLRYADEPPRRFKLAKDLAAGEYGLKDRSPRPSAEYPIADVRIGDLVTIQYEAEDNERVCWTVVIERRPGGRVPPAPREKAFGNYPRHHELMNVLQDWEAGIPIPDRYRAYFADRLPLTPVAPAPRLVVPRPIPAATP